MFAPCPPPREPSRPVVAPLPNACDAHCHVFGPAVYFPYAGDRSYTPPDAPLAKYLKLLDTLGCDRGVLVQGSAHGRDNAAMLDALKRQPAGHRNWNEGIRRVSGTELAKPVLTPAERRVVRGDSAAVSQPRRNLPKPLSGRDDERERVADRRADAELPFGVVPPAPADAIERRSAGVVRGRNGDEDREWDARRVE